MLCLALFAVACGAGDLDGDAGAGAPDPGAPPAADPVDTTTTAPVTVTTSTTTTTTTLPPTQDPAVAAALAGYTDWAVPTQHWADSRSLRTDSWHSTDTSGRSLVECAPEALAPLGGRFGTFPAFGFTGGDVLPGLIVDGHAPQTGDLRILPLERSELTLRSSLASENPTKIVATPDSATIAAAVAELKRDADARVTGIDILPADLEYHSRETHSFEENSHQLGVSLRYRSPLVQAGMDANYEQETQTEKHSITVRMVQRMYDISLADDAVVDPGDYFSTGVTVDEVNALVASGAVGADSPPMVIDFVSYGRTMYFTMTSTTVKSADELRVAVDAASRKYQGEAELTVKQRKTLSESEVSLIAYGGDQGLALAAIRSGDLNEFFGAANTTTAAPLSFTMRTLDGDLVEVADTADLNRLVCGSTPDPFEFSLGIDKVQGKLKIYVNGTLTRTITDDNKLIKKVDGSGTLSGTTLNSLLENGENTIRLRYTNLGCDNRFRVRVYSGTSASGTSIHTESHPTPGCFGEGDLTTEFVLDTTTGEVEDS